MTLTCNIFSWTECKASILFGSYFAGTKGAAPLHAVMRRPKNSSTENTRHRSAAMSDVSPSHARLAAFVSRLHDSRVSFVSYWVRDQMARPRVRTVFKLFNVTHAADSKKYYIAPGFNDSYDVYAESSLKRLLLPSCTTHMPTIPWPCNDETLAALSRNIGAHVSYRVITRRCRTPTVAEASLKTYFNWGEYTLISHESQCFLNLEDVSQSSINESTFLEVPCALRRHPSTRTVGSVFRDASDLRVVYALTRVCCSSSQEPEPEPEPEPELACCYLSDNVLSFVQSRILAPVRAACPDLEAAHIIYDEANELTLANDGMGAGYDARGEAIDSRVAERAAPLVTFVFEFEQLYTMNVFHMDAALLQRASRKEEEEEITNAVAAMVSELRERW